MTEPACPPGQPLRVYVAGGSAERAIVQPLLTALRAGGCVITHDWTVCEGYDRPSEPEERQDWARQDLDGVRSAEIVWLVAPEGKSEGSATELGAALALGLRVLVSGPHAMRKDRIFALLGALYDTHQEALDEILWCAAARGIS